MHPAYYTDISPYSILFCEVRAGLNTMHRNHSAQWQASKTFPLIRNPVRLQNADICYYNYVCLPIYHVRVVYNQCLLKQRLPLKL